MEIGLQSKYSGPSPTFVDCQKDSQTTVGNGTQVKPVLLAVKIFAVYTTFHFFARIYVLQNHLLFLNHLNIRGLKMILL